VWAALLAPLALAQEKYDFKVDGKNVESLVFHPAGDGKFPATLLIPGHDRTAKDLIPFGTRLAQEGFAAIAVSQPGYGDSEGPADYVGPKTIKVLTAAYRRFQKEPYVDASRMGIYGYSRGGMAASLLAVEIDDVKAAVLGAGVYDFKRAHDEVTIPGIARNMEAETGMTPSAIRERSSILRMDRLRCPVLILHGELDKNVPVDQAYMLRDRLKTLGKDFEIRLYPDKEHSIGPDATVQALDFFKRKLTR
jgi:dipeptidyl aminopeptidase/acylaminoacyl peptidase